MFPFKTLLLALTGVTVSQMAYAQTPSTPFQAQKVAHDLMRLNSGLLFGQQQKFPDVFSRISSRFEMTEVNPELVRRHEQSFARNSAYLNRTISRSEPYLHHVATEVERRNMPGEIALLPFIESAFVIKAKSPVGASGLWQFMPATGKQYGLEQNHIYDGRHDVYAATDAALNYLEYLYGLFGDWSLALAAYNWGEGNVGRAVKRAESQGLLPTYENLKMPQETRNYAPKLLAWRNIVTNPAAFGIAIPNIKDDNYFEALDLTTPIDTAQAARLAGISLEEFNRLNPGFNVPVFIPTAKRKMLLPKQAANSFVRNYQAADVNQLLSYNIYTPLSGDKLQDVAASFGMSDSELKQINGIRSNQLSAGVPVLVAKNRQPLVNPDFNMPTNGIEGDFNLAQAMPASNFVVRQADALSKPKAQLAEAPVLKVRASRAQPMIQQNFISPNQASIATQTAVNAVEKPLTPAKVVSQPTVQLAAVSNPVTTVQTREHAIDSGLMKVAANNHADTFNSKVNIETNSFAQLPQAESTDLIAQTAQVQPAQRVATKVVESDPLLALMNNRPVSSVTAPTIALNTPAAASQNDYAANAVRDAIARETAKEERAQERQAKAQAEAEKRERQLAAATQHKVSSGETLYSIAKTYDMSVQDLLAANGLSDNTIKVGQTLKVGKAADRAIQLAKATPAKKAPASTNYVVRKGDTYNSIAGKFNVKVNDLQKWNKSGTLRPGQKIQLQQL